MKSPSSTRRALPSRRDFVRTAGIAGSAALAATWASRLKAQSQAGTFLSSKDSSTEPQFVSATKLAEMIRTKQISAVEAVQSCYKRIAEVNGKLNAVVMMCEERALAEAKLADQALAAGQIAGPLHGVPMTIKDSFDTEGVISTGGTLGRKNFIPGKDATVVARVRKAGAILLGKTNTPEFTLGGGARGTYNLVYGQTFNPYNIKYNPSGSSGGAGSIVAAGGSYFDIGSDYGGSIRGPAFANGITGIKPTLGRTPRTGHIVGYGGAYDSFQETGPLARRVEDLYVILSQIIGPDWSDARMCPVPLMDPAAADLKSLRVCYYATAGKPEAAPEIQAVVKQTVAYFSDLGVNPVEDMPPKIRELAEIRNKFSNGDGGDHMRRLLQKHGTTQASPGLRIGTETIPSSEFTKLCEEMDAIHSEQLQWFEKYDMIICPASGTLTKPVPPEFARTPGAGGGGGAGNYTSEYNTVGWPGGVVRVGTAPDGLPIGVQIVAQPWRDDLVLAGLAYVESKSGGWQKPNI